MANRYETIEILRTELGKKFFNNILYPNIVISSDDLYIITREGDRLDNLAFKYYEYARLWWIIARANYLGKGDMEIPIGTQLRIPANYIGIYDEYLELNK